MSILDVTGEQFSALARAFQADDPRLKVDGIWGPKTESAVNKYAAKLKPKDPMQVAWDVALGDVGQGGDGVVNNVSAYIRSLRRYCGFPIDLLGPWCAIFASARLLLSGIPIKSRGAYTLCEKMANHPQGFEVDPDQMEYDRVYIACWKRGRWGTHQEAHVRLVRKRTDGLLEGIGGNERGDKVRHSANILPVDFKKGLIMVAGWNA